MARKTWLRMLSEHPSSHLIVARPVETDPVEMAGLIDRLIDRMRPRGSYASTHIQTGDVAVVMCAFEQEREALRMAGTMNAKPINRYVGWSTQVAFDMDGTLANAIAKALDRGA